MLKKVNTAGAPGDRNHHRRIIAVIVIANVTITGLPEGKKGEKTERKQEKTDEKTDEKTREKKTKEAH